ncbi:MAG TPA: sulfur reduction protein DsrE [Candidatus Magasanikbacteria bacterium]|nr:sulfur reduction protein DsrE [Candidatus Magasanikbacteria bacterium]
MKIGIIIYSNETEIVWNAFRLANFSLKAGDLVKIFLLSKGVEYEKLDSEKFNIKDQAKSFLDNGGKIFACGTCLKSRELDGSEMCPLSTMNDLYEIVKASDKIISF